MDGKTRVDRPLLAAFVNYLRAVRGDSSSPDKVDVVVENLRAAFNITGDEEASSAALGVDIVDVYTTAASSKQAFAAVDARKALESNPLFQRFLENARSKNFFEGTEPGTPAYQEKYEKAVQAFLRSKAGAATTAAATTTSAGSTKAESASSNDEVGAELAKAEGNTHMSNNRYKEAIECYSTAITKAPTSKNIHIYYANRAAAKTSLGDYDGAISDARRATVLEPSFAKAFSRLAVAHELNGDLNEAAKAYQQAADLDPSNDVYKRNLEQCKAKIGKSSAPASSSARSAPGGLPGGLEGLMSNPMLSGLFSNPGIMQAAQNLMSNPAMMNNIMGMMSGLGGGAPGGAPGGGMPDMPDMSELLEDPELEKYKDDPEVSAIIEECKRDGPMAFTRHMGNPKIQQIMQHAMSKLQ